MQVSCVSNMAPAEDAASAAGLTLLAFVIARQNLPFWIISPPLLAQFNLLF